MKRDIVHDDANDWMEKDSNPDVREYFARARQREISRAARGRGASRTGPSGLVTRLARRTGRSPEEIAARIPEDTLRRTRYAVIEERLDDGTLLFKHPKV